MVSLCLEQLRLQRLLPLLLPADALQRALLLHPDLLLLLAHHPRLAQADGDRQAPLPGAPLLRQHALRAHALRLLPLSDFFSRPPLCCVRFCCISVYDYVLLTIRFSRRLTAVDKRRFKVRLFSWLDSPAWVSLACLPLRGARTHPRLPGAQTHRPWPGTPKRL